MKTDVSNFKNNQALFLADKKEIHFKFMDEYCGKDIKLIDLTYNKQQMDFTLIAEITDEEDDVNEFEFTISSTVKY